MGGKGGAHFPPGAERAGVSRQRARAALCPPTLSLVFVSDRSTHAYICNAAHGRVTSALQRAGAGRSW